MFIVTLSLYNYKGMKFFVFRYNFYNTAEMQADDCILGGINISATSMS